MNKQGTVVRWNEERGFGFIRSPASTADVFFHARDLRMAAGRIPHQGLEVSFEEIHVGGKGPRAMAVQVLGAGAPRQSAATDRRTSATTGRPRATARARGDTGRRASTGAGVALPLMVGYALVIGWALWTLRLPSWVLMASPALNLIAFFAYWHDKVKARTGGWRTSEATLHFWSLAGGWAGAWLAQQVLRHKSSKESFLAAYRGTVVLHCAAVGGWLWWSAGA